MSHIPSPVEWERMTGIRRIRVYLRKRQAIEARQVARAERGIEWAPPLLRNGRAAR